MWKRESRSSGRLHIVPRQVHVGDMRVCDLGGTVVLLRLLSLFLGSRLRRQVLRNCCLETGFLERSPEVGFRRISDLVPQLDEL